MKPKKKDLESSPSTPDVSPERNKIAERHAREYPEGDPSVRRVKPESGSAGGRPVKFGKNKGKPEGQEAR